MVKIVATAKDMGGANAIGPVLELLAKQGSDVSAYSPYLKTGNYEVLPLTDVYFGKVLAEKKPTIVITGTSVQQPSLRDIPDQQLILAARDRNIPSLAVLDLWQNYVERVSNLWVDGKYSDSPGEKGKFVYMPDIMAVMDGFAKQRMVEEGFDSDKIVVTGNPGFDNLLTERVLFSLQMRDDIRNQFGVAPPTYLITWASQPIRAVFGDKYGFDEQQALTMFLEGLTKIDSIDKTLVVKAHPTREDASVLEKIVEQWRDKKLKVVIDKSNLPTRKVCMASDLLATPFSTCFYEALVFGVPAMTVQPNVTIPNARKLATYEFKDILLIANNVRDVEEKAKLLLEKPETQFENVKKAGIMPDLNAAHRIANLVTDMAGVR